MTIKPQAKGFLVCCISFICDKSQNPLLQSLYKECIKSTFCVFKLSQPTDLAKHTPLHTKTNIAVIQVYKEAIPRSKYYQELLHVFRDTSLIWSSLIPSNQIKFFHDWLSWPSLDLHLHQAVVFVRWWSQYNRHENCHQQKRSWGQVQQGLVSIIFVVTVLEVFNGLQWPTHNFTY